MLVKHILYALILNNEKLILKEIKIMKIVHICLNSIVTDGWNYHENMLTKFQAKDGHDVYMITSQWQRNSTNGIELCSQNRYINKDRVTVIRLPMFGKQNPKKKFKKYKGVIDVLEELSPDIIYIHCSGYVDLKTITCYLKKHPEVKVYADNHADFSNSGTNWLSKNVLHKIIWSYYERSLIPYVTKFWGVLPARVDFLIDIYGIPADKCELLVMGGDDDLIKEAKNVTSIESIRDELGISDLDFLIMTGGKIDESKSQTLLLMEAIRQIPDIHIKLVVFGSVSPSLKERFDMLLCDEKIKYIGWVDGTKVYKYFAASDLVVFPGRHSVFWEQVVALGIPMVVKRWEGTQHVDLGGNVEFIDEDNVKAIREVIERIAFDKEKYNKMKDIAQSKGPREFSYRTIARRAIGDN